jgi:hypothetical protein
MILWILGEWMVPMFKDTFRMELRYINTMLVSQASIDKHLHLEQPGQLAIKLLLAPDGGRLRSGEGPNRFSGNKEWQNMVLQVQVHAVRKCGDCDTKGRRSDYPRATLGTPHTVPVNSAPTHFLFQDRANQGKNFYILVLEREGENATPASSSVHEEKTVAIELSNKQTAKKYSYF